MDNKKRKKLEFDLQFLTPEQALENIVNTTKYHHASIYKEDDGKYYWIQIRKLKASKLSTWMFKRRISKVTGVKFKWDKDLKRYTTSKIANRFVVEIRSDTNKKLELGLRDTAFIQIINTSSYNGPRIKLSSGVSNWNIASFKPTPGEIIVDTSTNNIYVGDSRGNLVRIK